jgi:hypothetical protein
MSIFNRLPLQGLEADAEYIVSEPMPNNVTQSSGTLMIIETPGMDFVAFLLMRHF